MRLLTLIVKVRLYQNDFDCGLESGIMKRMAFFVVVVLLHVDVGTYRYYCTGSRCRFARYNIFRPVTVTGEPRQKKAKLEEGNLWRSFLSKEPITMKE